MPQKQSTKTSLATLFRKSSVLFAYQFGSTVSGHANRHSDVDIAVFFDPALSATERFNKRLVLMSALESVFKKKADVVALNDIESLFFKYVIVSEGRLIYTVSDDVHVDFELRTMNLYFDYEPFINFYNKHYVEKYAQ